MGLVLTTPPTGEPLSLTLAKSHLRVDSDLTADDALITSFISATRQEAEEFTGASLLTQTWTATYEGFPWWREPLPLIRGPVAAITSIHYLDPSGADQTLDSALYFLETKERSDQVRLVSTSTWPATAHQGGAVTVVYTAGYGVAADTPSKVPAPILSAMLLRIGDLYRNREAQIIERAVAVQNEAFVSLLGQYIRTPRLY